jgi:hypothetical protein
VRPLVVVLQNVSSRETRLCRMACLTADIPVLNASLTQMEQGVIAVDKTTLVVGSVEFVMAALCAAQIPPPENLSYAEQIQRFLLRRISTSTVNALNGRMFVKPLQTKAFTGFVYDPQALPDAYDEAQRESLREMLMLPGSTRVWVSEVVDFQSEWRYYIQGGEIIGQARYDDKPGDAPMPDEAIVREAVLAMGLSHPYTLDFGVLSSGQTALVEANDAFSIGLYEHALNPKQYLDFLAQRWSWFFLR